MFNIPKVGDEVGNLFDGTHYPEGTKLVEVTDHHIPIDSYYNFKPIYKTDELGRSSICYFIYEIGNEQYLALPDGCNFKILTPKLPTRYIVCVYYNHKDEDFDSTTLLYSKQFLNQEASDEYEAYVLNKHSNEPNVSVVTYMVDSDGNKSYSKGESFEDSMF